MARTDAAVVRTLAPTYVAWVRILDPSTWKWVEFVFGSHLVPINFSSRSPLFLLPQKPALLNSNAILKQWTKGFSARCTSANSSLFIYYLCGVHTEY